MYDPRYTNALHQGFLWHSEAVGLPGMWMVAETRVHGADCSDADHVPGGEVVSLAALPAYIGIRETRHAVCLHRLTEAEVLEGVRFPDAIANGSYRVDVHHSGKAGLTFRYLDGREVYAAALALRADIPMSEVDPRQLRDTLRDLGAVVL